MTDIETMLEAITAGVYHEPGTRERFVALIRGLMTERDNLRERFRVFSRRLHAIIVDEDTYQVTGVLLGDLNHIQLDLEAAATKKKRQDTASHGGQPEGAGTDPH